MKDTMLNRFRYMVLCIMLFSLAFVIIMPAFLYWAISGDDYFEDYMEWVYDHLKKNYPQNS